MPTRHTAAERLTTQNLTGSSDHYTSQTREALERLGFDDPYDPAFIYRSVFGSSIRGHAQIWPDIDFDVLREINSDTVGWVHMDDTPLDYPVVRQHLDRSYYLTHNFSGEVSAHGQIVLDFRHGGSLDGKTIVLHGHQMQDWSMMHVITEMDDRAYFDAHPTVQIAHAGGIITARWFAGAFFRWDDPWPAAVSFPDDAAYRSWLEHIGRRNRLSSTLAPKAEDRVLVCCTCSFEPGDCNANGYALFAMIEG